MENKKDDSMGSFGLMKEALKKDSEFEGLFARGFMFTLGAIILPIELIKVGLEKVGVKFDEGDGNCNPYDL